LNLHLVPAEEAVQSADIVLLLVGHKAFRLLAPGAGKQVMDTVGLWRR